VWVTSRDAIVDFVLDLSEADGEKRTSLIATHLTGAKGGRKAADRVVVLPHRSEKTPYGLYDFHTLTTLNPDIAALTDLEQRVPPRVASRGEIVVFAFDDTSDVPILIRGAADEPGTDCAVVVPRKAGQDAAGIYQAGKLASVLSPRDSDRAALLKAMVDLPNDLGEPEKQDKSWKVLVDCPVTTGTPPTSHRTVFEGPSGFQADAVVGRPPAGRELVLEKAAEEDLVPRKTIERLQQRLTFVITGEALITAFLAGVGWLTGNLAAAVRNEPELYVASVATFAAAVVVAIIGHIVGAAGRVNVNDLDAVTRSYQRRIRGMVACVVVSTLLYAVAVVLAVGPSIALARRDPPNPLATISFDGATAPATATVSASVEGLRTDSTRMLLVRAFPGSPNETRPGSGVTLLRQLGGPDPVGKITFLVKLPVSPPYRSLTAQIVDPDSVWSPCYPNSKMASCTVAMVPASGAATLASPSVTVTGSDTQRPTLAIDGSWSGLAEDASLVFAVEAFASADASAAQPILLQRLAPDPTGKATLKSSVPLPNGTVWALVQVWGGDGTRLDCAPNLDDVPAGCVVVRLGG
jgi:hypothetical protein